MLPSRRLGLEDVALTVLISRSLTHSMRPRMMACKQYRFGKVARYFRDISHFQPRHDGFT
jgi:hypothetical protein